MYVQISQVAPPLTGPDPTVEAIYQALYHILAVGVSAAGIKKGVDFLVFVWQTIVEEMGGAPGREMPGAVRMVPRLASWLTWTWGRRWIRTGALKGVKVGPRRWRVTRESIEAFPATGGHGRPDRDQTGEGP